MCRIIKTTPCNRGLEWLLEWTWGKSLTVNDDGVTLRYTTRQRNFESGLYQYREVLEKEKKLHGIHRVETKLSSHFKKTNDVGKFACYLKAKSVADGKLLSFYCQHKWRAWKFRIHCKHKSSHDYFLNGVKEWYGENRKLYYGDWSIRRDTIPLPPVTSVEKI